MSKEKMMTVASGILVLTIFDRKDVRTDIPDPGCPYSCRMQGLVLRSQEQYTSWSLIQCKVAGYGCEILGK